METGRGQAIFTAECSHSFHFACIGQSTQHGNRLCPVCRATWNHLPFLFPDTSRPSQPPLWAPLPSRPIGSDPFLLSDDEPLPAAAAAAPDASQNRVTIKAIPERKAVLVSESLDDFAVLVGLRAPPISEGAQRASVDLVAVLDVSGSMRGPKLCLLQRAVRFVVDNLGPSDRLSVVAFSTQAHRVLPLIRMTETGRSDAKQAVDSLSANGSTNIAHGLAVGARVLNQRHCRNPVASIMFLSDGRDSHAMEGRGPPEYLHLLPAFICPVHTFGFGSDHDPLAMHAISASSGGTFSFVESHESVQDAFAGCIGGLLSVVVRGARLMVRSAAAGVDIGRISSGGYRSEITGDGSHGEIAIGDLYADETKDFLVHVRVPARATLLVDVACSYEEVTSGETLWAEGGGQIGVRRPESVSPEDAAISLEVDRERNRVEAARGMAEAQRTAETGDLGGAREVLSGRRLAVMGSVSGQAGDELSMWLEAEMREMEGRMGSLEIYSQSGRAYALSNLSAHAYQRATTRGGSNGFGEGEESWRFMTPSMADMVSRSQAQSQAQAQALSKRGEAGTSKEQQ